MTTAALALVAWERRLLVRLDALATRVDARDESAWPDALSTITALAALVPAERRPLATTKEMAEKFGVTPRTIRKLGKRGKLDAVRLGARGTGAIRWRSA